MYSRTALGLTLTFACHLLSAQAPGSAESGCVGFQLGPPPPPPAPASGLVEPDDEYPDFRYAHVWCRKHWCEIATSLVPAPLALSSAKPNWSLLTVIRSSSWGGATYQISIRNFNDGTLEVEAWELPPWSALQYLLYEAHTLHPEFSPHEVAKSIPSSSSSKLLMKGSKSKVLRLLHDLQKPHKPGIPAVDDGTQWVLIMKPSGVVSSNTFFESQDQALSSRIFQILKLLLPKNLTLSPNRPHTAEEEKNTRRMIKSLIEQQPKEKLPQTELPIE